MPTGAARVFRGLVMRRSVLAGFAAAIGIPLSAAYAAAPLTPASAAATATAARHSVVIVVSPGDSIQAAVDRARPGDTVLVRAGVYHQDVLIRVSGITLRGSGNSRHGTVLLPPVHPRRDFCNATFGPTGVCVLARELTATGGVRRLVRNDTVTGLHIARFAGNGLFGYGTSGLTVTHVTAVRDGAYGISRFRSTKTLFAHDTAIGNDEAGFYVGDSPRADTLVTDDHAFGNQFGVFIRHARRVSVSRNLLAGNCQGILVLDDGQHGGAGSSVIEHNTVRHNNKFCPKHGETPVNLQGGGILLLGATRMLVSHNLVTGNRGHLLNSGGIVVASAAALTHGGNPRKVLVSRNTALGNQPADLIWDGTGHQIAFVRNRCRTSLPPGLCH